MSRTEDSGSFADECIDKTINNARTFGEAIVVTDQFGNEIRFIPVAETAAGDWIKDVVGEPVNHIVRIHVVRDAMRRRHPDYDTVDKQEVLPDV